MDQPYGVLDAGEWSVWCRTCSWRSKSKPLAGRWTFREAEAKWRSHPCMPAAGAPADRLKVAGPAPRSIREVS